MDRDRSENDEAALRDAKAGDLRRLQSRDLSGFEDGQTDAFGANGSGQMLIAQAITHAHKDMLKWLIDERFPRYVPDGGAHRAAFEAGVGIYSMLIDRWPHLLKYDFGHDGNTMGLAIFLGEKDMIEYLLSHDEDPNDGQFAHRSVSNPTCLERCDPETLMVLRKAGFDFPSDYLNQRLNETSPPNRTMCVLA